MHTCTSWCGCLICAQAPSTTKWPLSPYWPPTAARRRRRCACRSEPRAPPPSSLLLLVFAWRCNAHVYKLVWVSDLCTSTQHHQVAPLPSLAPNRGASVAALRAPRRALRAPS